MVVVVEGNPAGGGNSLDVIVVSVNDGVHFAGRGKRHQSRVKSHGRDSGHGVKGRKGMGEEIKTVSYLSYINES